MHSSSNPAPSPSSTAAPLGHLTILSGASRGLGRALAQQLLQPGALLLTLQRQPCAALAAQAADCGATLVQWAVDLSDTPAVAQRLDAWLRAQTPQRWSQATLINNAGVIPALVPLRAADSADLAHALRVGLEAPMLLCAAFLGATQHWALPRKVLNISSGLGRRPMASQSAYCAAKAGMDHFTRCLALDEARLPHGARVCALAPGVIDTDMQTQLRSPARAPAANTALGGAQDAAFPDQDAFERLHASGQLSTPEAAARAVLAYLARPDFGAQPVADVRA